MLVVVCSATKGDLPLDIQWFFNGKAISSGDGGVALSGTKRTSQIYIESISHKNQGNYTCVVRNGAGAVNHTAVLYVNGTAQNLQDLHYVVANHLLVIQSLPR